jgi:UDPglucose 6-dehydrogenase
MLLGHYGGTNNMKITVMGLGFVGLTTALGLAEKGHTVFGYDADTVKTAELSSGKVSLYEPNLTEALSRHLSKNFHVLSSIPKEIDIQAVFICVGTPCDDSGSADLHYLFSAVDILCPILNSNSFNGVIVIKSTVPPGTTKTKIIPYLREKGITTPIVNNPEFLREGYCWDDFINPDRIVCGTEEPSVADVMKTIYKEFNAPVIITSLNTAEFIKYLSNTLLASMISFSNEMSVIANTIGDISVKQAFETLHLDRRWGNASMKSYVYPGCGFGGYCLPKDLQAIIAQAKNYGFIPAFLESVQTVNKSMPLFFAEQILADNPESVGILGLSFKPGSDDTRESPAAGIISVLLEKNCRKIYVYDPEANSAKKKTYSFSVNYCESADEVCKQAKTVMLVTAWPQFREIDKRWPDVKFIDGRYIL